MEALRANVLAGIEYIDHYMDVLPKNNPDSEVARTARQGASDKLDQAAKILARATEQTDLNRAQGLLDRAQADIQQARGALDRALGGTSHIPGDDAFRPPPLPQSQQDVNAIPAGQRGVSFFSGEPAPLGALVPVTLTVGGQPRQVYATPDEADALRRGQMPQVRAFNVGGQYVPWYEYNAYDPYRDYWRYENSGWGGFAGGALAGFVGAELLNDLTGPAYGYGGYGGLRRLRRRLRLLPGHGLWPRLRRRAVDEAIKAVSAGRTPAPTAATGRWGGLRHTTTATPTIQAASAATTSAAATDSGGDQTSGRRRLRRGRGLGWRQRFLSGPCSRTSGRCPPARRTPPRRWSSCTAGPAARNSGGTRWPIWATRYRVLALDLPGTGGTPLPPGLRTMPDMARWLQDVCPPGLPSVTLVGHSLGGNLAVQVALDFPDMVRRLVLVGAALEPATSRPAPAGPSPSATA